MRTRCPVCSTVFRVTSEQLRLKAGRVRCGHCQAVFNGLDEVLKDSPAPEDVLSFQSLGLTGLPVEASPEPFAEAMATVGEAASEAPAPVGQGEHFNAAEKPKIVAVSAMPREVTEDVAVVLPEDIAAVLHDVPLSGEMEAESHTEPLSISAETPEDLRFAAQAAGLVAAREMNAAPGYSRWAAGTLESNGLGGFAADTPHRALWPFVIVSLLLVVALVSQLLLHFRTQVVQRWPSSVSLFELAAVDVPLPRNSEQVAIETSDLQSDNVRGLFVLQATLRNRASYPQAWPALELSLTDTNDKVVSRRILPASVYLPPASDPLAFPANGEIAVKLWLEAKDIGAAGYRLYIFYP